VAFLEATRSTHPAAGALNRAFDAFVAAGAPGDAAGREASRSLDERVTAARDALAAAGTLTADERRVAAAESA
jgi:hypothetical protein